MLSIDERNVLKTHSVEEIADMMLGKIYPFGPNKPKQAQNLKSNALQTQNLHHLNAMVGAIVEAAGGRVVIDENWFYSRRGLSVIAYRDDFKRQIVFESVKY